MKITLCGSTLFHQDFATWAKALSLCGHVVYSIAMAGRQESDVDKEGQEPVTDEQKVTLDLVHLAKIEESEAILVLNVGGYIGDSTRRDVQWARMRGKEVYWLETTGFATMRVWDLERADFPNDTMASVEGLDKYKA